MSMTRMDKVGLHRTERGGKLGRVAWDRGVNYIKLVRQVHNYFCAYVIGW